MKTKIFIGTRGYWGEGFQILYFSKSKVLKRMRSEMGMRMKSVENYILL
jgi:hypothetical protein